MTKGDVKGNALSKINSYIFYLRISQLSRSVQYAYLSQNLLKQNMCRQRSIPNEIRKISRCRSRFPKYAERQGHFTLLLCGGRAEKKCTKIYNARAPPLSCSFCGVLVAVAVVVYLSSLIKQQSTFSVFI